MAEMRRKVILEVPEAWFANPVDGVRHRDLYTSLLAALAELGLLIDPVWLPRGADRAPRLERGGDFTLSFHSYGPETRHVLRCKESYIPPFYTMDLMGYACFSKLARQPELFEAEIAAQDADLATAFVRDLAGQLRDQNQSKYPQPSNLATWDKAPGYIFVPLQMRNDAVSACNWLDPKAAVNTILNSAANLGMSVVIKRHPYCTDTAMTRWLEEIKKSRSGVMLSTASIHQLIEGAELVIGANSGVLFEALIQGKPVISYAASDFGQITRQVRSHDELVHAIVNPDESDTATRDRFLFWYLTRYCVRANDVPAIRERLRQALARVGQESVDNARLPRSYRWGLYGWSLLDRLKRRFF